MVKVRQYNYIIIPNVVVHCIDIFPGPQNESHDITCTQLRTLLVVYCFYQLLTSFQGFQQNFKSGNCRKNHISSGMGNNAKTIRNHPETIRKFSELGFPVPNQPSEFFSGFRIGNWKFFRIPGRNPKFQVQKYIYWLFQVPG